MAARHKSLLYGVGINDSDYPTKICKGKKAIWRCEFYKTWSQMLKRCYCEKFKSQNPSYKDCAVCDEWLIFSNFKNWMIIQKWEGMALDKDLILKGNKKYSPELCAFITKETNSFLLDRSHSTKNEFIGIKPIKNSKKYRADCRNGAKQIYLGSFSTAEEAHLAWKRFKHDLAIKLAAKENDPRASNALILRFAA
jgi:hypothetical protein